MRKTHWACLVLGIVLGTVLGVGLVILQMKYGKSPVVTGDLTAEAEQPSCIAEPTVTEDDPGDTPAETPDEPPTAAVEGNVVLGAPIQVPLGPVEFTALRRTSDETGTPGCDALSGPLDNLERVEQRLLDSVIRHAQAGGSTGEDTLVAYAKSGCEELPMPKEETAAPVPALNDPLRGERVTMQPQLAPAPIAAPVIRGKKTPLPYFGKYPAVLDCGYTLTLPAEVHEMMASPRPRVLYAVPGEQDCIDLFTKAGIRTFLQTLTQSREDEEGEAERRVLLSRITRVEVRANGELTLPAELVEEMGVACDRVMIVGVADHFEVWSESTWLRYSEAPPAEPVSVADLSGVLCDVAKHVLCDLDIPLWFDLGCFCPEGPKEPADESGAETPTSEDEPDRCGAN